MSEQINIEEKLNYIKTHKWEIDYITVEGIHIMREVK